MAVLLAAQQFQKPVIQHSSLVIVWLDLSEQLARRFVLSKEQPIR